MAVLAGRAGLSGSSRARGATGRRRAEVVAETGWCGAVCLAGGGGGKEGGHGLKFGEHICSAHHPGYGGKVARK